MTLLMTFLVNLTVIKAIVSVIIVMGLSLVAEHAGPKTAGILSGYPLGTALVLFFFGLEKGQDFAAASAPYALVGLLASLTFVFCYYKLSPDSSKLSAARASLAGVCGYLPMAMVLGSMRLPPVLSVVCLVASIFFFSYLFRHIKNHTVGPRPPLTLKTLLVRAGASAAIIIAITLLPRMAGPNWSGLFSSFPSTLFPLLLIVHLTYGKDAAHTIIKNFPTGLGSLIIYCLSVSAFYPGMGIYAGTAASFAGATLYLAGYALVRRKIHF